MVAGKEDRIGEPVPVRKASIACVCLSVCTCVLKKIIIKCFFVAVVVYRSECVVCSADVCGSYTDLPFYLLPTSYLSFYRYR